MRKAMLFLICAAVTGTVLGCSSMLEREYISVSQHVELKTEPVTDGEGLRAGNFAELKNAILSLVLNGETEGVIRLYNYNGDVQSDIQAACREVWKDTPMGAYAVDYIAPDYKRIVSYYELTLDITYRRTQEQIESVKDISGYAAYEDKIAAALDTRGESLAVRISYYNENIHNTAEIINRQYFQNPAMALGMPDFTVNVYPESGWQRIVEVVFEYPDATEPWTEKRRELYEAAKTAADSLKAENEKCRELYDMLAGSCKFDAETLALLENSPDMYLKTHAYDAYGALVEKLAVSEGYALAYKLICDIAGIECIVIQGRVDGVQHSWNLVMLDGVYYHVDSSMGGDDPEEPYMYFMKADEEFAETHKWNAALYPKAVGAAGE